MAAEPDRADTVSHRAVEASLQRGGTRLAATSHSRSDSRGSDGDGFHLWVDSQNLGTSRALNPLL